MKSARNVKIGKVGEIYFAVETHLKSFNNKNRILESTLLVIYLFCTQTFIAIKSSIVRSSSLVQRWQLTSLMTEFVRPGLHYLSSIYFVHKPS